MILPAIARKNWQFVGSEAGGHRAAILLSIIASAKQCKVEPWAWLNAVLKELPIRLSAFDSAVNKPPDLTDLLPDNWLKDHPEHSWKIDQIRLEERERSPASPLPFPLSGSEESRSQNPAVYFSYAASLSNEYSSECRTGWRRLAGSFYR